MGVLGIALELPLGPLERELCCGLGRLGPPQPPLDADQGQRRVDIVGEQLRGPAEQPCRILHPPLLKAGAGVAVVGVVAVRLELDRLRECVLGLLDPPLRDEHQAAHDVRRGQPRLQR